MGVKGFQLGSFLPGRNFLLHIRALTGRAGRPPKELRRRKYSRFVLVENSVDRTCRAGGQRGERCQTACKPGSVRARRVATMGAGRPFLWDAPRGAPRATNPGDGAAMPLRQPGGSLRPGSPVAPI